eukprot:Rmarinus@m.10846
MNKRFNSGIPADAAPPTKRKFLQSEILCEDGDGDLCPTEVTPSEAATSLSELHQSAQVPYPHHHHHHHHASQPPTPGLPPDVRASFAAPLTLSAPSSAPLRARGCPFRDASESQEEPLLLRASSSFTSSFPAPTIPPPATPPATLRFSEPAVLPDRTLVDHTLAHPPLARLAAGCNPTHPFMQAPSLRPTPPPYPHTSPLSAHIPVHPHAHELAASVPGGDAPFESQGALSPPNQGYMPSPQSLPTPRPTQLSAAAAQRQCQHQHPHRHQHQDPSLAIAAPHAHAVHVPSHPRYHSAGCGDPLMACEGATGGQCPMEPTRLPRSANGIMFVNNAMLTELHTHYTSEVASSMLDTKLVSDTGSPAAMIVLYQCDCQSSYGTCDNSRPSWATPDRIRILANFIVSCVRNIVVRSLDVYLHPHTGGQNQSSRTLCRWNKQLFTVLQHHFESALRSRQGATHVTHILRILGPPAEHDCDCHGCRQNPYAPRQLSDPATAATLQGHVVPNGVAGEGVIRAGGGGPLPVCPRPRPHPPFRDEPRARSSPRRSMP